MEEVPAVQMTGTISTPVKQLQMATNTLVVTEMSAMNSTEEVPAVQMTGTISTPVKQLQMATNTLVVTEMSAMKYAQRMLPDKSSFKK
ncbi:unnamed protein product [Bathycoccus prasinos]